MENRYGGILMQRNAEIIAACPGATSRFVLAHEFLRLYKAGMRVLEIGCGDGDSAQPLLQLTNAPMTLLDVSPEMIIESKKRLASYSHRLEYVCEDALEHLARSPQYDIVTSSWTIHNFTWPEKIALLRDIFRNLSEGGVFLLMDKIYPENDDGKLLELQCERYRYLDPIVAEAMIAHEVQDYLPLYRIGKETLIANLHDVGFRTIRIADCCEALIVLVAHK